MTDLIAANAAVAPEAGVCIGTAHAAKVFNETDSLPKTLNTIADESAATGLSTATVARGVEAQRWGKADQDAQVDVWVCIFKMRARCPGRVWGAHLNKRERYIPLF